jgi:catechol 2,3-dioxygenase-like lactoylglutathione lyase family enzyme
MATLRPQDLYHTGIVVEDLDAAIARFSLLGGYRWTIPTDFPFTVWSPAGETAVTFRFVYSMEAPHLELVQQVPGTVWMPAPGNAVHHLGYYADDLQASSAALAEAGLPIEACGVTDGQHPTTFAYHKGDDGIRVELVDRSVMGDIDNFLRAYAPEPLS